MVLAVCAGLALLGASNEAEGVASADTRTRVILVAAALIVGATAVIAVGLEPPTGPIVQGVVAGRGFGLTALAVRSMPGLTPAGLVRDPAAYAAAISGVGAAPGHRR